MASFKEIRGLQYLRLSGPVQLQTLAFLALIPDPGSASSCLAPVRPFVPSEPRAAHDYADIIRQDFENYITDIQGYFRCLELERARAFAEAREVSEDYGRFMQMVGD